MKNKLIEAIGNTIRENSRRPALSDYSGDTFTYSDIAERIARIHLLYKSAGIKTGDKVALCAKNSSEWAMTFLATMTYGAVPVPLLHEFHPDQIEHLTTHSESKLLFTEKGIADDLDPKNMPSLEAMVIISDFSIPFARSKKLEKAESHLDEDFRKKYPDGFTPEMMECADPKPDDLALINYTSGSSGNPKGVMLSYTNLWSNVSFALRKIDFLHPGDTMLSMLPLAHMYGLVFELLFPLCRGCHITFLGRVPSPKVVLDAFAKTKPQLVITVPLVVEKIVKTRVMPTLNKKGMKLLLVIPFIRKRIYAKVRTGLINAFGGNLRQLILGGAAVDKEVENLLIKIKFPFTIGYGMTECAPLITYEWWATRKPRSVGCLCDGMQARILSDNPVSKPGELLVKGDNVMMGYFKNKDATKEAIDKDGWLHTGDICTMDKDGYIFIKGRDKNMILGPSGQNIYPEEIEAIINNMPLVSESVVVDRDGKIVALVHPDYESGRHSGLSDEETDTKVEGLLSELNHKLPSYSTVNRIEIRREEFEKTPKHSIRRFKYQ